jgi:PTH1 family peptidyl-tRNA hydrolase
MEMVKLLAFLGNHGRRYENNRHNVAWQFLSFLEKTESATAFKQLRWERGFKGHWASIETLHGRLYLLKPETFMNLSGEAVADTSRFFKITPEESLIIHDELELPFGYFGLKRSGGLGGHNGLRSIKERLGTADFLRLRFGIGRPNHEDIAAYVLSDFSREEEENLLQKIFPMAIDALLSCIDNDFEDALNRYAKKNTL